MKVLIEAPFSLSDEKKSFIENKLQSLEKYNNRITRAEVYFKLDDGSTPDHCTAEIQLHVPGPVMFSSFAGENATHAFTGVFDKAKAQVLKDKEIRQEHN